MSVVSSMATGVSGLEAHGQALGVVSDNIANANTTGFKCSRGEFQSILAQDMLNAASGSQIGRGVILEGVTGQFTQGAITKTERGTDVSISGNGFFVVRNEGRGVTYTRDGSFRFDKDGWLTTLTGDRVQAWDATPDTGKVTGKLADIRIPYKTIAARPTDKLELQVNLDGRQKIGQPLNLLKPEETAQFTTGVSVYDSIGNVHAVSVYFNKTADATWEYYAMTDGEGVAGGVPGEPAALAQGTLLFDELGRLQSVEQNLLNTTFANGAVPDQPLVFDFGDPLDQDGTGVKGTTQYGSKHASFRNVQDGYPAGYLIDVNIDDDGVLMGVYNNGVNKTIGQLAMARFESTERLAKSDHNQLRETVAAGKPIVGKANTNGFGNIMAKSLEGSNVDLAKEFVDLMKFQRGFQANAKTITTAGEMLEEVINLRRT